MSNTLKNFNVTQGLMPFYKYIFKQSCSPMAFVNSVVDGLEHQQGVLQHRYFQRL